MTSNPSPTIERQLRKAWARKEWEYRNARWDFNDCVGKPDEFRLCESFMLSHTKFIFDNETKDRRIPLNWRAQCKPPLSDEGDE